MNFILFFHRMSIKTIEQERDRLKTIKYQFLFILKWHFAIVRISQTESLME